MPEKSGKCKSNPTKTNNLIYIMIFFQGGGGKKNSTYDCKKCAPN